MGCVMRPGRGLPPISAKHSGADDRESGVPGESEYRESVSLRRGGDLSPSTRAIRPERREGTSPRL
jgi:hypothetical protein